MAKANSTRRRPTQLGEGAGCQSVIAPVRDLQPLTLDTNTACSSLSLSENNRKVTADGQHHSYPDHPDRFEGWGQVLCTESLTGRCYWEVDWSGDVEIAVAYRGISRKGDSYGYDCRFGWNKNSWRLRCSDSYLVGHNWQRTVIPVRPSSDRMDSSGWPVYSGRVAVYVDHPAGTLSFYEVSSDTLTLLYTFQDTFTEPLYAGFGFYSGSVRLV